MWLVGVWALVGSFVGVSGPQMARGPYTNSTTVFHITITITTTAVYDRHSLANHLYATVVIAPAVSYPSDCITRLPCTSHPSILPTPFHPSPFYVVPLPPLRPPMSDFFCLSSVIDNTVNYAYPRSYSVLNTFLIKFLFLVECRKSKFHSRKVSML